MTTHFRDLALSAPTQEVLTELGLETPTPIQAAAIPVLLAGRDVLGRSRTGTGKTLAFAIPLLERVELEPRVPRALVLCPTRELCAQVARELRKLARKRSSLQVLLAAGGQPIAPQIDALARGAHVVVGTPGRLLDLLQRRALDLRTVATVVLDEADRMLEMGFEADVETILRTTPATRQTVLFSATLPPAIHAIAKRHLREPVPITIDDESVATVEEQVYLVDDKLDALLRLLATSTFESALVFCNQKATVDAVTERLARAGASVARLHGDLEQFDRDRVLARLRNGSVRVLVATDVAARGLDVDGLDLVVSFDRATSPEVHLHRTGRTGRAGRAGLAVSLLDERSASTPATGALPTSYDPRALARPAANVTLWISGGRKEKLRPGDLLGALTGEAGGLRSADVGKIEIHDHHAYVAIARAEAERALGSLREGRIKGRRFRVQRAE